MDKLESALRDPSQVFKTPAELLNAPDFTKEQKIEILRHWAYDQLEMLVAEEENMRPTHNNDTSPVLDKILRALRDLGVSLPLAPQSPTKQGNI